MPASPASIRFGAYELDPQAGQLTRNGRAVRLKPQPLKLLHLLASRPGEVLTREDIRIALWGADTFVDFEQGVNSAIRKIRDALNDDAERPLYVETIPKRGYRFIAPVETPGAAPVPAKRPGTDLNLHKALWLNIAELRLAEVRRRRRRYIAAAIAVAALLLGIAFAYLPR